MHVLNHLATLGLIVVFALGLVIGFVAGKWNS